MKALGSRFYAVLLAILSGLLLLAACKSYKKQQDELQDTMYRGKINVSADESFKPIVDQLVKVYESNFPGTTIAVQYKAEAQCLNDIFTDSIRLVIATKAYTKEESDFIADSTKIGPESMIVARDAVAVIVNPNAPDSVFTMQELRDLLTGRFKKNLIPVFDGVKATSTVRFIVDSVLLGDSLSPATRAARTSEAVIEYVANHPDAVGFIGVSWIGNKDDPDQISFLKKVKLARLESKYEKGKFIWPVQANIYYKTYPMVRDLVYILKEKHQGLGHGFADFMSGEIGQLIFKRAYLMPAQKNFTMRPVKLNE